MAVKDDGALYPTENIISKLPRKHYRISVRSQHWQLRSLISADKRDYVYFPGGHGSNQIQRLDITSNDCQTIKLLTFAPRCLVAQNGWLCCGSETGEFVAMRLDEESDPANSPPSALPAWEPNPRQPNESSVDGSLVDSLFSVLPAPAPPHRRSGKGLIAKSMKLAQERVNCITLWFPPSFPATCEEAYNEPVAVLANNDRTVSLVSLNDFDSLDKTEPLDVIEYPDFVNRAIISPDGSILVAILDDPYLYVHKRVSKSETSETWAEDGDHSWEPCQRILLKSQTRDDKSDSRGSFAACFSSSGSYLAVGTQHGTMSIFNATLLTDLYAEPLITTFQSTRPYSGPGAIRDMEFSPGPYDVLAWTEDRGHVGIADVRSNFKMRQIIDINDEENFRHINIVDRNTIDPRLLDSRNDRGERPRGDLRDALSRDTMFRDNSSRREDSLEYLNRPLTSTETTVLEAIRGDRRRARERGAQRTAALRNATEAHRPSNDSSDPSSASRTPPGESDTQRLRDYENNPTRAVADLLGSRREHRDRAQDRYRFLRSAIRDNSDRPQASRTRGQQRLMDSINETVDAMRDSRGERQDLSYLSVLEMLQSREGGNADDDTSLLVPLVNQVVSRWEESAVRGTLAPDHGVFEVPPSPDNTAGLAWSDSGTTLFVGAQNGIYEFRINMQSRKLCPSFQLS